MRRTLALALIVVSVAACSSETDSTTTTQPLDAPGSLLDTSWVGSRIEWQGADYPMAAQSPPTIEFTADGIGGTTGCNSYFGSLTLGDGQISIDQVGQTEMACEPPLMDQERVVVQILLAADLWTLDGGTLTIGDSQGDGLIEFVAPIDAPALPLIGTTWTLTEIISGDAVSSVVNGVVPTLIFDGDEISGSGGCNTYTARAIIEDGQVGIDRFAATARGCGDQAAMDQETQFFRVLEAADTFTFDGQRLIIEAAGEGLGFRSS